MPALQLQAAAELPHQRVRSSIHYSGSSQRAKQALTPHGGDLSAGLAVATRQPGRRRAVIEAAAAKNGASEELRTAAVQCLDWAPARRRAQGALAPVLPTIDHCLFKMAPQGIQMVKKSSPPIATDAIYYAGTGNLLCKAEDRVTIFDLQQRLVLGELQAPAVKYVVWSTDMESVALLSKHAVVIASKKPLMGSLKLLRGLLLN